MLYFPILTRLTPVLPDLVMCPALPISPDLQINETVHKTITRISEITFKFRRNYPIFIEKLIFLIDEALNDIVKAVRFQTA